MQKGTHKAKGNIHQGTKKQCVICSGKGPAVLGYQGGGITGVKI